MKRGEAVLMFPEGTRHKDGRLGDARPGVGLLAKALENDLVTAMDAVEVADGDDGAPQQAARPLETSQDLHG